MVVSNDFWRSLQDIESPDFINTSTLVLRIVIPILLLLLLAVMMSLRRGNSDDFSFIPYRNFILVIASLGASCYITGFFLTTFNSLTMLIVSSLLIMGALYSAAERYKGVS